MEDLVKSRVMESLGGETTWLYIQGVPKKKCDATFGKLFNVYEEI